jgi:hypothetical protein
MLGPRFKSLWLVSFFIGHDQGVAIGGQDDTMSLHPMSWNVIIIYIHQ